jgi:hypothetical protein
METGIWVIIIVGIAVAVYWQWRESKTAAYRKAQEAKAATAKAVRVDDVKASLSIPGGRVLRLTSTALIEGYGEGKRHPLGGLVARVEEGGSVNRRYTVTRIVALGILAAGVPKKIDDRMLYLTIEGPETLIVHEISVKKSPRIGPQARAFAAAVNQSAKAASATVAPLAADISDTESVESRSLSDRLRELAQLRDDGILSEAEYEAKKAQILERF